MSQLRSIAVREKVSLNTLVSQVFDQYLNWDASAPKAGLVPLPKSLLVKILDKVKDEEIIKIADFIAEKEIASIVLMLRKEHNIDSFMSAVESWAKTSNFASSSIEKPEGVRQHIIQHDMGKKWSLYYKRVFEKILGQLKVKSPRIDITDHTLVITYAK